MSILLVSAELALLEAQEAQLGKKRGHLHNQIDFGYATESAKQHEREISAQRQQLHNRIEELRDLLAARERV